MTIIPTQTNISNCSQYVPQKARDSMIDTAVRVECVSLGLIGKVILSCSFRLPKLGSSSRPPRCFYLLQLQPYTNGSQYMNRSLCRDRRGKCLGVAKLQLYSQYIRDLLHFSFDPALIGRYITVERRKRPSQSRLRLYLLVFACV
jgi:hypothetical protein